MKIICLINNWVGWKALELLRKKANVVGVVLHSPADRKYGKEILRALPKNCPVFMAPQLKNEKTLKKIAALKADMAVSVFYGYIVKSDFIGLFPKGCINLHPGYLPFNQGTYPNVWSLVEQTPAGVTLHYIDEGIDSGDIIAQLKVPTTLEDTGLTLYRKLELASIELLKKQWPLIVRGKAKRRRQSGKGTFHRKVDVENIDHIDLNKTYKARTLIDLIRARTFPPYKGAYVTNGKKRIYLRLELNSEK
jgi:methionyl-tRNA formyltransferase